MIGKIKSVYARWEIPFVLVADNGHQFRSEQFKQFCENYGFTHITSSPMFPQSPTMEKNIHPQEVNHEEAKFRDEQSKTNYAYYYDRKHSASSLPLLNVGGKSPNEG